MHPKDDIRRTAGYSRIYISRYGIYCSRPSRCPPRRNCSAPSRPPRTSNRPGLFPRERPNWIGADTPERETTAPSGNGSRPAGTRFRNISAACPARPCGNVRSDQPPTETWRRDGTESTPKHARRNCGRQRTPPGSRGRRICAGMETSAAGSRPHGEAATRPLAQNRPKIPSRTAADPHPRSPGYPAARYRAVHLS